MNDPLAAAAIEAIHTGDVDGLRRLLHDVPALATVRVGDDRASRTLLHVVADWPGHFPRGVERRPPLVTVSSNGTLGCGRPRAHSTPPNAMVTQTWPHGSVTAAADACHG